MSSSNQALIMTTVGGVRGRRDGRTVGQQELIPAFPKAASANCVSGTLNKVI